MTSGLLFKFFIPGFSFDLLRNFSWSLRQLVSCCNSVASDPASKALKWLSWLLDRYLWVKHHHFWKLVWSVKHRLTHSKGRQLLTYLHLSQFILIMINFCKLLTTSTSTDNLSPITGHLLLSDDKSSPRQLVPLKTNPWITRPVDNSSSAHTSVTLD